MFFQTFSLPHCHIIYILLDHFFAHFFSFNLHLNFCFSHFSIPSIHNAHWCSTLHHRHLRSKITILYLRSFPPIIDKNNRIHFWIITAFVRLSKTVHLLMQKTVKLLANKYPSLTKSSHFSKFNLSKFVVWGIVLLHQ